ncbi:MAG: flippase-like domain-containing protein [Anaerolineae bacterium]|nr:flippase-like domain-containing protein [Anaerolineae bacterium]
MTRNKWLIAGSGILISIIFLGFAFRNLHPEQVLANIGQADGLLLLVSAAWYFAAVAVITLRWQFLLNTSRHIPLRRLIPLVCIGYAGNNIYPFRSGEVLRIVLLQRNHGVPLVRGTTTVLIERVFDGLVMLTFVIVSLLLSEVPSPEVHTVAMVAAPIFLTALAIFFVLAARPNLLRQINSAVRQRMPERAQKITSGLVEDIINGLDGLRSPADLAGAVVSSYVTWALEASVYWIVSMAFNLGTGYPTMLLVVGVVNLAGLIPASPGQFGVFETFASVVLVAGGVPQVLALAFALSVHMVIWLPVTLVGLAFLLQQGLNLSAIARAQQLEQNAAG